LNPDHGKLSDPQNPIWHSEIDANLLNRQSWYFRDFSECGLIDHSNHLDFDSAIPRFESWRPSHAIVLKMLSFFGIVVELCDVILNAILLVILNACSCRVRQAMRVALSGCRECPFHGSLRVTLIGSAFVRRQRSPLPVRQLCFLKFRHAAMPAGVQRERRWELREFTQPAYQLGHAGC